MADITRENLARILDVLQGISRGLVDVNVTLRRIAAAVEGGSRVPALGEGVWPGPTRDSGRRGSGPR